jgi:hypothetical protein
MELEQLVSTEPDEWGSPPMDRLIRDRICMPSLMLKVNSNRFAQMSEMIRYFFVNATGVSGGCGNLFDKLEFLPDYNVEKLYLLRMHKMTSVIQLCESRKLKAELAQNALGTIEIDGETCASRVPHWKVCFPHEGHYIKSEVHPYNSFYTCKFFETERNTTVESESRVLEKSMTQRKAFLKARPNRQYCTLSLLDCSSLEEMAIKCKKLQFGLYNPNVLMVGLASALSMFQIDNCNDIDTLEESQSHYNPGDVCVSLSIRDIMNNRGSLHDRLTHTSPGL